MRWKYWLRGKHIAHGFGDKTTHGTHCHCTRVRVTQFQTHIAVFVESWGVAESWDAMLSESYSDICKSIAVTCSAILHAVDITAP